MQIVKDVLGRQRIDVISSVLQVSSSFAPFCSTRYPLISGAWLVEPHPKQLLTCISLLLLLRFVCDELHERHICDCLMSSEHGFVVDRSGGCSYAFDRLPVDVCE